MWEKNLKRVNIYIYTNWIRGELGSHFPLQRIFPIQGSNPGLLHFRQILLCEPPGKPITFIFKRKKHIKYKKYNSSTTYLAIHVILNATSSFLDFNFTVEKELFFHFPWTKLTQVDSRIAEVGRGRQGRQGFKSLLSVCH